MALIECYECGKQVSDSAAACPNCGAPVKQNLSSKRGGREPYTTQEAALLLSQQRKTNHVLHLLLTIITGGLWIIVWILVSISNASHNSSIERSIRRGIMVKK